jgi:hypothetical protein
MENTKKRFAILLLILVLSLVYSSYGGTDGYKPRPDPMTWRFVPAATGPYTITMTATTALDANDMPVQYLFTCTTDGNFSSGWQSSPTYEASGLTPNTTYSFRVRACDNNGGDPNTQNRWSTTTPSATTDADTTPPMLKLDFNYDPNNDDANTQTGFTKFILPDSGSEVNGIIIDLAGDIQSKREEDPCGMWEKYDRLFGSIPGDPCYYSPRAGERIYRDFIYGTYPSGVTITLWDLGVNRDCNITIWAYDACSTGENNRVANWYANGTYIFDTDFTGGPAGWPRYDNDSSGGGGWQNLYKYAFSGKATSDELGRIILTGMMDPKSEEGEPFAFVNALSVEPNVLIPFVPTNYAHRPVPFDGTEDVPVNTLLKWGNGEGVVKHDLYLGTNEDAVADATRASHPGVLIYDPDLYADANQDYDPCGAAGFLELDKTYYWRVDENSPPNLYKGEVWSFKTAKCVVVENFNSYGSTEALKDVWKDFWTQEPPLTSAEVSLAVDPNRGGPPYQSMRYWYGNNFSPYYSEARVDIGTGADELNIDPDWLGMGAKALVLWFYGTTTNDVNEKMYVKLTDGNSPANTAKVIYDGDMNDIRKAEWQEWNIDLQNFVDNNHVNLTDVKKITIGFGDGTTRGTGTVYFEDIQLCVCRCILAKRSADFAKVDYAPLDIDNRPGGDCMVDYQELAVMTLYWLDVWNLGWAPPTDYVAYWPMNEGTGNKIYTDPCDPRYTGTFSTSGVTWATPGEPGWGGAHALYFDGKGGTGVDCGTADLGIGPTPPDVNAMTLSVWVKWSGPRNDPYLATFSQGLISKENGWGEPNVIFRFELDGLGYNGFTLRHYGPSDEATPDLYSPSNILTPFIGHWIHLAATYPHPSGNPEDANSFAKLYLNGVEVASGPWRFSHGDPCTTDLTIGNNWTETFWPDGPESFYGYLDEVRIYNRVLTAEEISYMAGREPPCDLYSEECIIEICPQVINLKDYDVLMNHWLERELWP